MYCNWLRKSLCKLINWCIHGRDKPPTKGVLVVNTNLMRVKRPLSFKPIWSPLAAGGLDDSSPDGKDERDNSCSIWFPEAPKGYVALSCVVSSGSTPPSLASAFCILASSVSPCSLRDCIAISSTDMYAATNLSLLQVAHFLHIWTQCMHKLKYMGMYVPLCLHVRTCLLSVFHDLLCVCDLYATVSNEKWILELYIF